MDHRALSLIEAIFVIAALVPIAFIMFGKGAVGEIREIRKHLSGGDEDA